MKERISQHFNMLFEEAPKTRKALDLKQEMLQNAQDKYDDLLSEGYTEEDAYRNVVDSIGDVTELFVEVQDKNLLMLSERDRKKKAMITAIAVGLYILAAGVFFFFAAISEMANDSITGLGTTDLSTFGLAIAVLICIAPTIMLVYAANMYPGYTPKAEPNMVEQYKEERHRDNKSKGVRAAVSSLIWTLALTVYFLVSFLTGAWHLTWIIFLIAGCVESIAALAFSLRKD